MRDKRKDEKYFREYLDYQNARIEKKTAKLAESEGEKRQRVLISLTGYEIDLIKAEYSFGASKGSLKALLRDAVKISSENNKPTYDDILVLLSLAIMLGEESIAEDLIDANHDIIQRDRLLNYLSSYIKTHSADWDLEIPVAKEYELLNQVFSSDDKTTELQLYLENWYNVHSEYSWYDSHLRDTDTYCGYWSFEAGAIATINELDVDKLKDNPYFPVL